MKSHAEISCLFSSHTLPWPPHSSALALAHETSCMLDFTFSFPSDFYFNSFLSPGNKKYIHNLNCGVSSFANVICMIKLVGEFCMEKSLHAVVLRMSYICNHNFLVKETVMLVSNSNKWCNMERVLNEIISFVIVMQLVWRINIYFSWVIIWLTSIFPNICNHFSFGKSANTYPSRSIETVMWKTLNSSGPRMTLRVFKYFLQPISYSFDLWALIFICCTLWNCRKYVANI